MGNGSKEVRARLSGAAPADVHSPEVSLLGWEVLRLLREYDARTDYAAKWERFADELEAKAKSLGLLKGGA